MNLPAQIKHEIDVQAAVVELQRQHRQEPGIRRVLSTLISAGCTPVVLKGAALAYSRYTRPHLRSFADLDLLLPSDQIERANQALLRARFFVARKAQWPAGHHHLPPLFAPRREIVVELHHTLFDEASPFHVDAKDLLSRAVPISILGFAVRELAPTDALLHVSAHLSYGHRYRRYPLRSLIDMLALSHTLDFDWAALVTRARQARASGAVGWPLYLAWRWLDAPIPLDILDALLPGQPLRHLIGTAMHSGYVLDRASVIDNGTRVAFDLLSELSIHGGHPVLTQIGVLLKTLFPAPSRITHLPPEVVGAPDRYLRELMRPSRISRGIKSLGRLALSDTNTVSSPSPNRWPVVVQAADVQREQRDSSPGSAREPRRRHRDERDASWKHDEDSSEEGSRKAWIRTAERVVNGEAS